MGEREIVPPPFYLREVAVRCVTWVMGSRLLPPALQHQETFCWKVEDYDGETISLILPIKPGKNAIVELFEESFKMDPLCLENAKWIRSFLSGVEYGESGLFFRWISSWCRYWN